MELALYCPVYGYYEKEKDNLGRSGDFFTSVSVGNLFGELLAFQFAEWLTQLRNPKFTPRMVEAGAHRGQLAKDILTWLRRKRTPLFETLEYVVVEPSERHQRWQKENLAEFGSRIRWVSQLGQLDEPQDAGVHGIIFSNELLDAMPVHRLGWDAARKAWFEWGVALEAGRFVWAKLPELNETRAQIRNPELPEALLSILPDGFVAELCPAADAWWQKAAGLLREGKLLTLDYGLTAEELFAPERSRGTLRACFHHHVHDELLSNAGDQDLTAHVNFTGLRAAGESAGLKTTMFVSQEKFLTQIAQQTFQRPADFDEWTSGRARQFQTLTHPEHLGRSFQALVQSR